MAIKGADLLHVADRVLLERAQTAGPGQVNLNPTKVYELGNYQSIATIFDIPDLTFSVDSFDASAALEAKLCGHDFDADPDGTVYDLSYAKPLDVMSEFKEGRLGAAPYDVAGSIGIPFLILEQVNYRFGLTENASQTAQLRGDAIFYNPGSAFQEHFAGTNTANQTVVLAQPAYPFRGDVINGVRYTLGVKTTSGRRLRFGTDYTETVTGTNTDGSRSVSVVVTKAVPASDGIDVIYSSPTVAQYPQLATHTLPSITRPAAIRGRDIEVFVGGSALGNRWTSVQSVTCDYRVTLQRDEEFGNYQLVDQDFDVPDVSGTLVIRPRQVQELFDRVRQIASVTSDTEVVGALATTPLEVLIVLHSPDDGSILKSLIVPDARITVPAYSGQVQQKLDVTFNFSSDTGQLRVVKGARSAYTAAMTPSAGAVGDTITVTGTGLDFTGFTVNGTAAAPVTTTATSATFLVPAGATTGAVVGTSTTNGKVALGNLTVS